MNNQLKTYKNKIITIFKNKTINILLLLSLLIILILIYLKNKKIDLFTSFIDNYINAKNMYSDFQLIMNNQAEKINILGEDIQTVINGDLIPLRTTMGSSSITMSNTTNSQSNTTMKPSINKDIIDLAVSASGINIISNEPFSNLLFNQNTINNKIINNKIINNKEKFNDTPIIFNTLPNICNNMSEYIRIFFPLINIQNINNSVRTRQNVDLDTMIKNVYDENDTEFGLKLLYFAKGANFINYYSIAYITDKVYACICLILYTYHLNKFSNNNHTKCSYIVEPIDYTQKSLLQYYGLCEEDTSSVINIINNLSNTEPISEINVFNQPCSNTKNELCKINSYNAIKNTVYNYLSNTINCTGFTDLECNKKKDDFLSDLKNNNNEQQRLLELFEINIATYFITLCNPTTS
jgi:hypothetical protein